MTAVSKIEPDNMTAQEVEDLRQYLTGRSTLRVEERKWNALCELALDGLRFRAWIEGASWPGGDPVFIAKTLAKATKPNDYRLAIDGYIVQRAKRR